MPSIISNESAMDASSSAHFKKRQHDENAESPKERRKAKHPRTDQVEIRDEKRKSKKERPGSEILGTERKNKGERKHRKDKTEKTTKIQLQTGNGTHEVPGISFPFFTQTISLWVPLYPVGFDRPISSVADQHLSGLLNHYSPLLGGYLLAYSNVNLSDSSVRADPNNPSTDKTPAILTSVDEYAVGYAWMTVDVDLFIPSRGAWLEGNVILQNEGAIGVNCWERFNASIEASRLPREWKFVDLEGSLESEIVNKTDDSGREEGEEKGTDEVNKSGELEGKEEEDQRPLAAQVHTTGYWADESGKPVKGNVLFRIKDFDVGLAGDNGYLAIEGTMLGPEEESRLVLSERDKNRTAKTRGKTRRLPEFSITQFGKEGEEDEDGARRTEMQKRSHAGTPDS